MPSDTVRTLDEVNLRLKSVSGKLAQAQASRSQLRSALASQKAEVLELSSQIILKSKVEELFKALIDALVLKQLRAMESLVTEGLQTIFWDQDLQFEAEVSPKYNKVSIDFFLKTGSASGIEIKGAPLESFGGGPSSVVALLLRTLTLLKLKRFPVLLLDETLAAVSDEYTDSTGKFLQVLSSKMGVPILMITHKPAYLEHATRAYKGSEVEESPGRRHLSLKRVV